MKVIMSAFFFIGLLALPCYAKTSPADQAFLTAEKAAKAGNYKKFQQLTKGLSHPLKPYVQMEFYKRHPNLKYKKQIEHFLSLYQSTPVEQPVRKAWLTYLAKKNQQTLFIKNYRPQSDVALQCQYLNFKLQQGADKKEIFKKASKLWVVGRSQPKACDNLFYKWKLAGYRTEARVWQRVKRAAEGGQASLLPYLKLLLPKSQRYLADLYAQVRKDPSAAAGLYRYKHHTAKEAQIALYGIKRLIWRNPDLALRAWFKLERLFNFTPAQLEQVQYSFAYALAAKKLPKATFWVNKVAKDKHTAKLRQAYLMYLLAKEKWPEIIAYFTNKPNVSLGHRYWMAYAHAKQGQRKKANKIWQEVAKKRDYYGFLAAARVGKPVRLNNKTLTVPATVIAQVEKSPNYLRALALHRLQRYYSARAEWNYLLNTSSDAEKYAAAVLADKHQWYDSTITTLARLKAWDYVDLRFPDAFSDLFSRYAKRHHISRNWAVAIARRESSFAPDARSHANARGLMQLLPSTAKYMNKSTVSNRQLYQPKTNINLGSKYLRYLEKKAKSNRIVATASYNAGYRAVSKWLPKTPMAAELWIEQIPYRETRKYVKNVYAYRQVYLAKANSPQNLMAEILNMKIGG